MAVKLRDKVFNRTCTVLTVTPGEGVTVQWDDKGRGVTFIPASKINSGRYEQVK